MEVGCCTKATKSFRKNVSVGLCEKSGARMKRIPNRYDDSTTRHPKLWAAREEFPKQWRDGSVAPLGLGLQNLPWSALVHFPKKNRRLFINLPCAAVSNRQNDTGSGDTDHDSDQVCSQISVGRIPICKPGISPQLKPNADHPAEKKSSEPPTLAQQKNKNYPHGHKNGDLSDESRAFRAFPDQRKNEDGPDVQHSERAENWSSGEHPLIVTAPPPQTVGEEWERGGKLAKACL